MSAHLNCRTRVVRVQHDRVQGERPRRFVDISSAGEVLPAFAARAGVVIGGGVEDTHEADGEPFAVDVASRAS